MAVSMAEIARMNTGADLKDQVEQSIRKNSYDVADFYTKSGFSQWFARHPRIEQLTLAVIALNAIWIWVETDLNPSDILLLSPPQFQLAEHLFCIYFSYEWTMRFLAFRKKRDGLRDFWFVFDGLLVCVMVFETWVMSVVYLISQDSSWDAKSKAYILRLARLLRLTRMGRMARVLRALPELLILMRGMIAALRSVCFAMGLLIMLLYVFGIAFTQLCEDTALQPQFSTVLTSMNTLLLHGAFMDDISDMSNSMEASGIHIMLLFYVFVLLAALTILNMLIGVICDTILTVGDREREASTFSYVTEKIKELVLSAGADEDHDGLISRNDFKAMLANKKAVSILYEIGVDVVGLVDMIDVIFEEEVGDGHEVKNLTFVKFMEWILDLRAGKAARVKDILSLRKHINDRFQRLESQLMDMHCEARHHRSTGGLQEAALSGERTATGAQGSSEEAGLKSTINQSSGQSHLSGVKTVTTFQDIVAGSLRDLQASHERELMVLQRRNLRLLDKLRDLRQAAGKSLTCVLDPVPGDSMQLQEPKQLEEGSFWFTAAPRATAEPETPESPCPPAKEASADPSRIDCDSMGNLTFDCALEKSPPPTHLGQPSLINGIASGWKPCQATVIQGNVCSTSAKPGGNGSNCATNCDTELTYTL